MIILYRACRVTDLCSSFWGLFNYGLANHRGTNVNATFTNTGYHTQGLATTENPKVAFCYACMQAGQGHDIGLFAIRVDDGPAALGSVKTQALAQNINALPTHTQCWKSVTKQKEVVLPNVRRDDILGYYTVDKTGNNFDIDQWVAVSGKKDIQDVAKTAIESMAVTFKNKHGGTITAVEFRNQINKLMGVVV